MHIWLLGASPQTPHPGLCPWTPPGDFRTPDPLCPSYLQTLATPLRGACMPRVVNKIVQYLPSLSGVSGVRVDCGPAALVVFVEVNRVAAADLVLEPCPVGVSRMRRLPGGAGIIVVLCTGIALSPRVEIVATYRPSLGTSADIKQTYKYRHVSLSLIVPIHVFGNERVAYYYLARYIIKH